MIRFTAKRPNSTKLHVGIVLLPEDLRELMAGFPQFTVLSEITADDNKLDSIGVYFFRDLTEFQEAMRDAGVQPRTVATEGPSAFVSPPLNKIGDN